LEDIIKDLLSKDRFDIDDLVNVVIVLRSENGCPWDKVQTHRSIKKDFLEEVYEVMEAIDCESPEMMREELGDVLLQVVFHTVIEQENGNFVLEDVITELCQKLIVRHPHVFGNVNADTVDKVLTNWDAIKKETKGQETYTDTLKSVPKNFPALMRAQKLGKRAARAGIDFGSAEEIMNVLKGMINNNAYIEDILFVCANAERHLSEDAEEQLAGACDRFVERFEELEKSGRDLTQIPAGELYSY